MLENGDDDLSDLGRIADGHSDLANRQRLLNATFNCIEEHLKQDPNSDKLKTLLHRAQEYVELSKENPNSESHFVILLECLRNTRNSMVVTYSLQIIALWVSSAALGEWMIKYECAQLFLNHLMPVCESQRSKLLMLEIFANLMSEGEEVYKYCCASGVVHLFLTLYHQELENESFEINDASSLTLIEAIGSGLMRPVLYPTLMDDAFYSELVQVYASILRRRDDFGIIVADTINASSELLTHRESVQCFIDTGLVGEILAILNDPISNYWQDCFYFLGVALAHSPVFSFLADPPNLIELCNQCCLDPCFDQFIAGFCFYLAAIFNERPQHLTTLIGSGFFLRCLPLVTEMSHTCQMEYVRMLLTVLEKGGKEDIARVLDPAHLSMFFEVMEMGDDELLHHFFSIHGALVTKLGPTWMQETGLNDLLARLLEDAGVNPDLSDETRSLAAAVLETFN